MFEQRTRSQVWARQVSRSTPFSYELRVFVDAEHLTAPFAFLCLRYLNVLMSKVNAPLARTCKRPRFIDCRNGPTKKEDDHLKPYETHSDALLRVSTQRSPHLGWVRGPRWDSSGCCVSQRAAAVAPGRRAFRHNCRITQQCFPPLFPSSTLHRASFPIDSPAFFHRIFFFIESFFKP